MPVAAAEEETRLLEEEADERRGTASEKSAEARRRRAVVKSCGKDGKCVECGQPADIVDHVRVPVSLKDGVRSPDATRDSEP